ncbi:Aim39p KNAG_0G03270 [Huiozyma naganishii CBS 8797]|uniref:Altered inheritance of mitochondria protein 39, mitochondrial n=1 Tax=Huiozyma naganishii (strain ATCC MYA-139 / BCRC 22969 / CBS 8797 / KCTC 17520 / NBRC 10181 / NCYC 3082 / Yp74L-3) TaxID=1071383 RepID=J7R937_HUIN7|nr:hypothetical protein KNAG_0G03270 [Kazachstania naganishii CBS 8797]CCK71385.1 hypothetical protein KNAG_0G03270 [Kazachstania naganishii CBS 8797]
MLRCVVRGSAARLRSPVFCRRLFQGACVRQRGRGGGGVGGPPPDSCHFFSNPGNGPPTEDLTKAIHGFRTQRRRAMVWAVSLSLFGALFGYQIGYKVMYLGGESYIPLFPCLRIHELSEYERSRLNLDQLANLVEQRVVERLSSHEFIQEQYGVPLRIRPSLREQKVVPDRLHVWCEDEDPVIYGISFRRGPTADERSSSNAPGITLHWHRVPFLFEWRFSHKSIDIRSAAVNCLESLGIKYDRLLQPEAVYGGTFRYEHPLGDPPSPLDRPSHSMHVCFYGEFKLDNRSLVTYKGKWHVDVKFDEICLLRNESDERVRYVLYRGGRD